MFKLVVLSVVLAVATANPSGLWGTGVATAWGAGVAAPLVTPLAAPFAAVAAPNYRGPLSLAPGQPANILADDGRPLDTLSVNLDRAVHLTAKALEGSRHWLKKRSIVAAPLAAAPLIGAPLAAAPLAASWIAPAPVAVAAAAPIAPLGLGLGARIGHLW